MDIEQLKLILETIGAAGDGALWFGILWLSKGIIITMLWLALIMYVMKIKFSPFMLSMRLIQSLKDFMGFRGDLTNGEAEKILNTIKFADDVITASGLAYDMDDDGRKKILKAVQGVLKNG
jgi:hypothetical protein